MLLNVSISDDLSRVMAVSANRKAQAGFLCPVRAPPPYFGHFSNLTKNIGAFQMQSSISTQIQTIQNQAQTVTIPRELANRIMDALYYGGEFIANTGAIIDTICDNMADHSVRNTPHKCERKHGTTCHSHSNPSPPCGKLGIFRFVIRACGIHSKLTPSPRPDDSDGLKEWAAYSVTHAG